MAEDISDSSSLSSSSGERPEDMPDPLQDLLLNDVTVSGRELGAGSYSSVLELSYKGMICAGKRLHKTLYNQGLAIGPEILERFGIECELLSQLRHPQIVQFIGLHFEEGSDVPILVLEYMSSALSDSIEQYGVLPNEISYSILHDVALGLYYLHTHSPVIIHRDLTANNVLLTPSMTAKISDLGMAKIINISPAQIKRQMTVCPGTLSYMPPEALTSDPQYDTKLDCFSFGVLTTHVFCGEWPIGSEYLQPDPKNPGHLYPLTEVQRREKYLLRIGSDHPLLELIHKCLKNLASERPDAQEIMESTKLASSRYPVTYDNRVDLLNQIKAEQEEKEQLKSEVEDLRCLLHEKEHTIESLSSTYAIEGEKLRERVAKLEQVNALQDMQLGQLQAENSRLQLLLASKRNELDLFKKREKTLTSELAMANCKMEEKASQSLEKLKQLQGEITKKSEEREEALKR
jgi:serine/threonine protein kinase